MRSEKARATSPKQAPGRGVAEQAKAVAEALKRLAEGDYSQLLDAENFSNPHYREIAALTNQVANYAKAEVEAVRERNQWLREGVNEALQAVLRVVNEGELSGTTGIDNPLPSLGPLIKGLDQLLATLRAFTLEMGEASLQISTSATEVLAAATQQETAMTQHASAVHETTATMAELKSAAAQIADNARTVATIAEQTLQAANEGEGSIRSLLQSISTMHQNAHEIHDAMGRLSRRVERIGSVVEVIDEIADRADLLALNAALEGAKAGEAGRGFSIVAAEMRRLAENVLASTKEIKGLIGEVREATDGATQASERNRRSVDEGEKQAEAAIGSVQAILSGVQETNDSARVIHLATQQQRTATEQVVQSMTELEMVTRQSQEGARQASGAAAELARLAERLSSLSKRFRVS